MRTIEEKESLAYQDTNEPYELAVYKRLGPSSEKAKNLVAITADITLDRLTEICEAERDGRCVVSPCKVGDIIYKPVFGPKNITEWEVTSIVITGNGKYYNIKNSKTIDICISFLDCDIGETVFLAKEEAEKALKEISDEKQI